MSVCKECIHYEVCMEFTDLKKSEIAQGCFQSDVLCKHFIKVPEGYKLGAKHAK